MSEALFKLSYDGEAVADGEMDVTELAPALLGLGQMLKAAGKVADGDDVEVGLKIRATREGSFEVLLSLTMHAANGAWSWWKGPDGHAADELLKTLGITGGVVGGSVIAVVKALKGRKPDKIVEASPGFVTIHLGGESFEAADLTMRIALDPAVRAGMEKAIADPLEHEGISTVWLGDRTRENAIVKREAQYFRQPVAVGETFSTTHKKIFSIISLSFKPGQKWKLNDGFGPRTVTVSDADFVASVDRSEISFAKGDLLVCEVVETARRTASGFKSEYEIVKVIEHRPPPAQPPLL